MMILYMKQKMIMMIIRQEEININKNIYYDLFNILDENIYINNNFSNKSKINLDINDPIINNITRINYNRNDKFICEFRILVYNKNIQKNVIFVLYRIIDKNGNINFKSYIGNGAKNSYLTYYVVNKIKWRLKIIFKNYNKYRNDLYLNMLNIIDNAFIIEKKGAIQSERYIKNRNIEINKNNIKEIKISLEPKILDNKLKSISIIYEIIFKPRKIFFEGSIIIKRNIYSNYQKVLLDNIFIKQIINESISVFRITDKKYEQEILKEALNNINSCIL